MFPSDNGCAMDTIPGKLLSFLQGRESKEMDAVGAEYLYLLPAYNIHTSLSPPPHVSMQLPASYCGLSLCNVSCIDLSFPLSFPFFSLA